MTPASTSSPASGRSTGRARETVVLANPEWIRREGDRPRGRSSATCRALEAHVWVATSGTSSEAPGRVRWVALVEAGLPRLGARGQRAPVGHRVRRLGARAAGLPRRRARHPRARAAVWREVVAAVGDRWNAAASATPSPQRAPRLSALVPSQIHDLVAAGLVSPPSLRAIVVGGARLEPALYRAARGAGLAVPAQLRPHRDVLAGGDRVARRRCLPTLPGGAARAASRARFARTRTQRLSIRASSLLTCCAEFVDGDGARVWDPKRDGWLETDDLGRASDGTVEVLGRVSESVKVLGEMVSLPRVEEQALALGRREGLRAHRRVRPRASSALPHARLGHELVLRSRPARDASRSAAPPSTRRWRLLPRQRCCRSSASSASRGWIAIPRHAARQVQRPARP